MKVHVVGSGLAGLSAAVHAKKLGADVTVYEASSKLGGRIRRVGAHDNGTHLLVKGYQHTFEYLSLIKASDKVKPYPSKAYRMCEGPLNWDLPGKHIFGHIAKGSIPGVNIFNLFGKTAKRRLWEPLYMAVFNTPADQVPRKLVLNTFLEILKFGPEAMEPYFATTTLQEAFITPALDEFEIKTSTPLRKVTEAELVFKDQTVHLGTADKVILALPSYAYEKVEHPFELVSMEQSAITNIHFYPDLEQRQRFFGLINTLSQWVYTTGNHICVTISHYDTDRDDLADHVWKEIRFHLDMAESRTPDYKIITEKFATPLQNDSFLMKRLDTQTGNNNLFLAGDWVNTGLPCTIEGAIKSGKIAAKACFL